MGRTPAVLACTGLIMLALAPAAEARATGAIEIDAPATAAIGHSFAVDLRLAPGLQVAAFDSAVLVDDRAAQIGAAIPGVPGATMLSPAGLDAGGARIGFFGGHASGRRSGTIAHVLVTPRRSGRLELRFALPTALRADGSRIPVRYRTATVVVRVGAGGRLLRAPHTPVRKRGLRAVRRLEIGTAVYAWQTRRATLAEVQTAVHPKAIHRSVSYAFNPVGAVTWTVNTTADALDAAPGDRVCATAAGTCSLRAAIDEANRRVGDDQITFAIPGAAPQTIQLTSLLTAVNSTRGALLIDGYTQPGAHPNTDPTVSNAQPGVVLRGYDANQKSSALMITSAGNIVRGLAFTEVGRAIYLYGPNANDNSIVGNWIGLDGGGQRSSFAGYAGIDLDGAPRNRIGTPNLADRNVIAGFFYGIDHVSPGTDDNRTQNNLIGTSPNATQVWGARCDNVDHNVGPKRNQLGGLGAFERNVIIGGGCDGVELSHGWNQSLPPRTDISLQYQVNDNRILGNYIGLRADGSYDPAFISARGNTYEGDGSGVNIIDVSNGNLVEGNYIAAQLNAVQIFAPFTTGNIARNNFLGVTPSGGDSFVGYSGVSVRWQATNEQITGNVIGNTGRAGVRINETSNTGNLISRNVFRNLNGNLGIDLEPIGQVNPNDDGDADPGANLRMNFPVVTAATTTAITGTANAGSTVELFTSTAAAGANGPGSAYVGTATASALGTFSLPASLPAGTVVTATATDAANNTSEFAVNTTVATPPVNASDSFSRTVANGWGIATSGGAWTIGFGPATAFAVNGSAGTMSLPAAANSREQVLASLALQDATVATTMSMDKLPVGGSLFTYVVLRRDGSGSYRAKVRIAPDGRVYARFTRVTGTSEADIGAAEVLVSGLTASAGVPLAIKAQAIGTSPTTLRARVWLAGTAEPVTWNVETTDADAARQSAGNVGLRAYSAAALTNAPVVVGWDDLSVS